MKHKPNKYVLASALVVSSGAFCTGYIIGSFSGVLEMPGFNEHFTSLYATNETSYTTTTGLFESNQTVLNLTSNDSSAFCESPGTTAVERSTNCGLGDGTDSASFIGLIVAVTNLGSLLGSLLGGWISDWISRKYSHILSLALYFIGALITASAYNNHEWMLILGRSLCGYSMGSFYAVMPVYISEISPKDSRGVTISMVGPMYALGHLVSVSSNIGFAKFYLGWRISIGAAAVFALMFIIGARFIPHSPRWLVKKGRDQEALLVLAKINRDSKGETFVDTYLELESLKDSLKGHKLTQVRKEFCKGKHLYRLSLMMVVFLLDAWATPFITYYPTSFFCEANVPPFFGALAVGVVFIFASIATIFLIDKIGRKVLFLTILSINVVSVVAVAALTQFCASNKAVAWLIVILLCVYAFGYSSSWLALPWVINGEVFPIIVRGLAAGIASSSYWFFIFGANILTPVILTSPLKTFGLMYITAGFNLFAFFFILLLIPETKGVSLENMDRLFSQQDRCGVICAGTSAGPSFNYDPEDDKQSINYELGSKKPTLKIYVDDLDLSLKYD